MFFYVVARSEYALPQRATLMPRSMPCPRKSRFACVDCTAATTLEASQAATKAAMLSRMIARISAICFHFGFGNFLLQFYDDDGIRTAVSGLKLPVRHLIYALEGGFHN
jgi:hypothetical protein